MTELHRLPVCNPDMPTPHSLYCQDGSQVRSTVQTTAGSHMGNLDFSYLNRSSYGLFYPGPICHPSYIHLVPVCTWVSCR